MTLTELNGTVPFKVAGQSALPKWMQTALKDALDHSDAPPESLRFQCRIATDAQQNLARIELDNGETLTLHPKARPQFGKNKHGQAFLTATMTYSGDGESYSIRWVGEAVPQKMQEIAVKHDKGLSVKPTTVRLSLADAVVTPAAKAHGNTSRTKEKARESTRAKRARNKAAGITESRAKRNCARLTDADLSA